MLIPIGTDQPLERTPWTTIILIVVTCINYILAAASGKWMIPLPVFQHADIYHLFGNMLFLWIFGSYLESKISRVRFILYYFLCEMGTVLVFSGLLGGDYIGASGAISGIMALYLARFYHAKLRMMAWIVFFPVRFSLPVKFLVPLWFSQDLVFGMLGVREITNVAYFAHVAGFLTGLLIAKFMRFDVEGRVEHHHLQAVRRMTERDEMPRALKELQQALNEDFNNPMTHLLIARHHSRSESKSRLASKYYLQAISRYTSAARDPVSAALVYHEMVKKCGDDRPVPEHLKYASCLAKAGCFEDAASLLGQLVDRRDLKSESGKKALFQLIHYASEAEDKTLVIRALNKLKELFPDIKIPRSVKIPDMATIGRLPTSDEMFARKKPSFWLWLNEMMNERAFWLWWSIMFLPVFLWTRYYFRDTAGVISLLTALLLPTFMSAIITCAYRGFGELVSGFLFGTGRRKTERQALRDFNISTYFNKGMRAERKENYLEAVRYYKGVLAEDPKHIEARYQLARIYHQNLHRKGSAIAEYESLLNLIAEGTHYHTEIKDALEELRRKRQIPEPVGMME
jgi:membrane associated rhomboid family serine protease